MGGTVAVTLRKPDGTQYRMNRWTNSMPWGIGNMKMLNHDMDHVDEYLKQWLEMQDDYKRNKDSGVFEHNMTECYFPSMGLAPCGYGLVVVDMVNNVILEMQGYTSFDSICAASIGLDIMSRPDDTDGNVQIFKEFMEAGKVTGQLTRESFANAREDGMGDVYIPVTQSFDELIEIIGRDDPEIFDFKLDLAPFSYETFEECEPAELVRMRTRILELGFTITDEENAVWDALIKEYEEEYGE